MRNRANEGAIQNFPNSGLVYGRREPLYFVGQLYSRNYN